YVTGRYEPRAHEPGAGRAEARSGRSLLSALAGLEERGLPRLDPLGHLSSWNRGRAGWSTCTADPAPGGSQTHTDPTHRPRPREGQDPESPRQTARARPSGPGPRPPCLREAVRNPSSPRCLPSGPSPQAVANLWKIRDAFLRSSLNPPPLTERRARDRVALGR